MPSTKPLVVILATGGTIAGRAASRTDTTGYVAGAVGIEALLESVPELAAHALEHESVAAIDSKDMDAATWQRLAARVEAHLARPEVAGVVVTHGTDTLEETAWLLHRVLAPRKPVVLTAAMRPSSAISADGPANLLDAVGLAGRDDVQGVCVVLGGGAWHPEGLRKRHTLSTHAFDAGDAGPIARLDGGTLRVFRAWASGEPLGLARLAAPAAAWPRVEILMNHAGADGALVDAAVAAGARGLVVAGTGHGSLSTRLAQALDRARARGVRVMRATRCAAGPVLPGAAEAAGEAAGELGPPQARVELLLRLLGETAAATTTPPAA